MPVIKKSPLVTNRYLLSEETVIDALIILDSGFKLTTKEDRKKLNSRIDVFLNTYRHSYSEILEKIRKLLPSIVEDVKNTPLTDLYKKYIKCFLDQFNKEPVKFLANGKYQWIFKEFTYEIKGHYTDEQIRLLILEDFDRERRYFEKLKSKI